MVIVLVVSISIRIRTCINMSNPNFLLYPQKRCSEEARVGMPMVAYFIAKDLVALYEAGTTIIITTSITITMTVCHGLFETLISYWDVYY